MNREYRTSHTMAKMEFAWTILRSEDDSILSTILTPLKCAWSNQNTATTCGWSESYLGRAVYFQPVLLSRFDSRLFIWNRKMCVPELPNVQFKPTYSIKVREASSAPLRTRLTLLTVSTILWVVTETEKNALFSIFAVGGGVSGRYVDAASRL